MDTSSLYLLLFVILMVILAIQMVVNYIASKKRAQQQEPPVKFITSISCINNDYRIERDYSEGDFVGKIVGSCPKCGSPLVIDKIFSITIQQQRK